MTDDKLSDVAFEIDDFISVMVTKHQLDPLILGSICLARLALANDYFGSGSDFRKLMKNVPEVEPPTTEAVH